MSTRPRPARSLEELLLLSDFGRADPARVRELLDAAIRERTGGTLIADERDPWPVETAEKVREAA